MGLKTLILELLSYHLNTSQIKKEGLLLIKNIHFIKDSLISSWLLPSVSANILPQLVGCKSAHEIWLTIEHVFNTQSAAKIMYYKRQLRGCRKENLSMRDYLTKIKTLCDQLASVDHKITDTEQVLCILGGVDDEYESFVAVISSKKVTPSIQYVHSTLLAYEERTEQKKPAILEFSANFVSNSKSKNQERNTNARNQTSGYQRGSMQF